MPARASYALHAALIVLVLIAASPLEVGVWVDERGRLVFTDRDLGDGAERMDPEQLELRWRGHTLETAPPPLLQETPDDSREPNDVGDLRGAYADVQHGELRHALRTLRRLVSDSTVRVEAAWLLARLELHRGRLEPARDALAVVTSDVSAQAQELRPHAESLLAEIEAELAHAKATAPPDSPPRSEASEHYTLIYDHALAGRDFGERLLAMLEQIRGDLQTSLGRTLPRSLDVRLYTRAQYLASYKHRFGFATVGFYDGAIHAVSTRQPRLRLKALLTHEHTHALFMEALGSHEPFFLNEGLAEREEERVLGRGQMAEEDWRDLLDALRGKDWLPLRKLVSGFAELDPQRARLAYLESRAAVELLGAKRGGLQRWLERCATGQPWEAALREEFGWGVAELDAALGRSVRERFPDVPEGFHFSKP